MLLQKVYALPSKIHSRPTFFLFDILKTENKFRDLIVFSGKKNFEHQKKIRKNSYIFKQIDKPMLVKKVTLPVLLLKYSFSH